jgi:transposase
MARPSEPFNVSEKDISELQRIVNSRSSSQGMAQRAHVVLLSIQKKTIDEIMVHLDVCRETVVTWRRRFRDNGLDGLSDSPRTGRPTTLDPALAAKIIKLTIETIPQEAEFWSERLMAKHVGATKEHVRKVWAAADLRPHRIKNFKISNDPQFAEKVGDIVGLYMSPPDNAAVISVDEKTQIQALERTQRMLPLKEGKVETKTHDYIRHGTASLYAAFDIASGEVIGRVTERHRAQEFISFMRQVETSVPKDLQLHVILDNSSTHKTNEVKSWLENHPRVNFHFTPTSASWLNAVEGWFAQLERRSLKRTSSCRHRMLSSTP